VVIDQGSTNGTYINGIRCPLGAALPVKDSDVLLLSQMEIILHVVDRPG
jgi:pSer/pThr/pTyr-binding forkhead associated (FHA) protein